MTPRNSFYVLVRLSVDTLWAAIRSLKSEAARRHDEARLEDKPLAREARHAEADYLEAQSEEIRLAMHRSTDKGD